MPHLRPRHVEARLKKALAISPIVGVLGQRQVGKTTLLNAHCAEYSTFDKRATLSSAESDPESFLENRKHPFGMDECQLVPALFPALKESVRVLPKPGRFILTGSIRFTSRRLIRESLTGRIVNVEVLPLSLAEAHDEPLPSTLVHLMGGRLGDVVATRFSGTARESDFRSFHEGLERGGLPGICFFREAAARAEKFESHIETLLERDLRLVVETTVPFAQLRSLLLRLAETQGEPLELASLSRATRISTITLKTLLSALESIFVIRRIPTLGGSRKDVVFLEDTGMAGHLARPRAWSLPVITHGLYASLRTQFAYRPELGGDIFQYRTRKGAWVPIAFRCARGILGVIPSETANPGPSEMASAASFLKAFSHSRVVFASRASKAAALSDRLAVVPLTKLVRG